MTPKTKLFFNVGMSLLLSAPLAILVTLMIFPFWNWFEQVTGIESFGHSGPADWCFIFDYTVIVVIMFYGLYKKYNREKSTSNID